MKKLVSLLFIAFTISLKSQIGIIDPTFNIGTGSNNFVYHVTLQPDQKILASGNFTSFNGLNRKFLVRLNTDGSVDNTFNPQINASGAIRKTFLQSDGKIIAFGYETDFTGYVVRLKTDGSIDTSFITPATISISDIAQTPDGKLLIAGNFSNYSGYPKNNIARLNNDGSFDLTFNAANIGADNGASSIIILSDHKILIGGYFSKYNNVDRNGIARLNSDGTLDESFNAQISAKSIISSFDLQGDGKILIGGYSNYNGNPIIFINKITEVGNLDSTFNSGTGPNDAAFYLKTQSSGKLLATGAFTTVNNITKKYVAILNENGSLEHTNPDTCFDEAVFNCVNQNDGKLVCGGAFTKYGNSDSKGVVRIIPNDLLATSTVTNNEIQISPNPATDVIHIKTSKLDIEKAFIFDLSGKLIMTEKAKTLNVSHLPSATYIISIKTSEGLKSFKFIKQ